MFKPVTFKTRIGRLQHLVGMHYFEIPVNVVKKLGGKFKARLVCTVNDEFSYQCGLVALGEGKGYISVKNQKLKQLGLQEGDLVVLRLEHDDSEFGMEVPEELTEVFAQDETGFKRFSALTPGKQRYIIHYVNSVKNPQLRADRAIMLITNLKALPEGKENFAAMLGKNK